LLLLCGLSLCVGVSAQDYPARGVRFIVGAAAGGPIDSAARVIGEKLAESWKQPVTVENRVGASEMIAAEHVSRAAPDGYTLLFSSLNVVTNNPVVFAKVPYDAEKGFAPVVLATSNPMVLMASPKASFSSLRELVDAAKAKPGTLSWSSPGLATTNHIAGEWLAAETGAPLFHVPYKGGPAAANAILSGDVPFGVVSLIQALPLAKAGTVKVIAVTTQKRTPLAPDWPTVAEQGVPGFDAAVLSAPFAPAGTPQEIVTRLNAEVNRVLRLPEIRERFAGMGVEPAGSTPDELAAGIKRVRAQIEQVVARAKIKVQ
jgi:tripartite-type tricarboxylate transporter receptor subunit TctC